MHVVAASFSMSNSWFLEKSDPLSCNFCRRWRCFIAHLLTQSGHLLAACSLQSLSHLLTACVIAAGFAAVTDHWLAVSTALANWLFGMVAELIGNIITSPPWSVACLFFFWMAGSVADYSGNITGCLVECFLARLIRWLIITPTDRQGHWFAVWSADLSVSSVDS